MIIWRRFGILVPVCILAASFMTQGFFQLITGSTIFYDSSNLGSGIALILSGVACYLIGLMFEKRSQSRVYIERDTGRQVVMTNQDTFFFINIKYWGFILPAIGLIQMFF